MCSPRWKLEYRVCFIVKIEGGHGFQDFSRRCCGRTKYFVRSAFKTGLPQNLTITDVTPKDENRVVCASHWHVKTQLPNYITISLHNYHP